MRNTKRLKSLPKSMAEANAWANQLKIRQSHWA